MMKEDDALISNEENKNSNNANKCIPVLSLDFDETLMLSTKDDDHYHLNSKMVTLALWCKVKKYKTAITTKRDLKESLHLIRFPFAEEKTIDHCDTELRKLGLNIDFVITPYELISKDFFHTDYKRIQSDLTKIKPILDNFFKAQNFNQDNCEFYFAGCVKNLTSHFILNIELLEIWDKLLFSFDENQKILQLAKSKYELQMSGLNLLVLKFDKRWGNLLKEMPSLKDILNEIFPLPDTFTNPADFFNSDQKAEKSNTIMSKFQLPAQYKESKDLISGLVQFLLGWREVVKNITALTADWQLKMYKIQITQHKEKHAETNKNKLGQLKHLHTLCLNIFKEQPFKIIHTDDDIDIVEGLNRAKLDFLKAVHFDHRDSSNKWQKTLVEELGLHQAALDLLANLSSSVTKDNVEEILVLLMYLQQNDILTTSQQRTVLQALAKGIQDMPNLSKELRKLYEDYICKQYGLQIVKSAEVKTTQIPTQKETSNSPIDGITVFFRNIFSKPPSPSNIDKEKPINSIVPVKPIPQSNSAIKKQLSTSTSAVSSQKNSEQTSFFKPIFPQKEQQKILDDETKVQEFEMSAIKQLAELLTNYSIEQSDAVEQRDTDIQYVHFVLNPNFKSSSNTITRIEKLLENNQSSWGINQYTKLRGQISIEFNSKSNAGIFVALIKEIMNMENAAELINGL